LIWTSKLSSVYYLDAVPTAGGILAARDEDEETEAQRIAVDPTTVLYLYRIMHSTQVHFERSALMISCTMCVLHQP
jgi:hypothetical protein